MAFFENTYQVDITPGATKFPVINVSQYDNLSRTLQFELIYEGEVWQIPTGCEAYILGTKPDGLGFMIPAIILDNKVVVTVKDSMTAIGGLVPCEIRITSGTDVVLGTTNFILKVECAAMDDNTAISDADIAALEELLRQYREFSAVAATAETLVAGSDATASYSGGVFYFGIPTGPDGKAATITVGETKTGEPGTDAEVTNTGTSTDAILNFVIPRGSGGGGGDAPTITVGETTTGEPGTPANVVNTGTSTDVVLEFTIPRGVDGRQGVDGKPGADGVSPTVAVGTTTTSEPGGNASVINSGTSTDVVLDFVIPRGVAGPAGESGKDGSDGKDGCLCAVEGTVLVITNAQASGMNERY